MINPYICNQYQIICIYAICYANSKNFAVNDLMRLKPLWGLIVQNSNTELKICQSNNNLKSDNLHWFLDMT